MSLLETPRHEMREEEAVTSKKEPKKPRTAYLFRTVDKVPAGLIAALATGVSGLFLAYVSLWARINELNQWGTFGMRFGFLVMLSLPLAATSLSLVGSYRPSQWRALGNVRMALTTLIGVSAFSLSILSAYVMYTALP